MTKRTSQYKKVTQTHNKNMSTVAAKHHQTSTTDHAAPAGDHGHGAAKTERSYFMFWIYLMTDLLMFAGLFAAFAVLRGNTFGGPGEKDIYSLPLVLSETFILLASSYTSGLAVYFATKGKIKAVYGFLCATGILGASFLALELTEFSHLIHDGNSYTRSAFLSSYFSLVGTHGLHIAVGLLWLIITLIFLAKRGLVENMVRKITFFSTFWHFLDLVWIFIFSFVYLMGVTR
jgi:cytochrome o ubiquinol oxidase subunit 3